jgi:hypothetical protein
MKAQEFQKSKPSMAKPRVAAAPVPAPTVLAERKRDMPQRDTHHASTHPVYGITDPQGSEISRIKQTQPHLWNQIKNWD